MVCQTFIIAIGVGRNMGCIFTGGFSRFERVCKQRTTSELKMNETSEIKIPTGPTSAMPPHEQLMRQHLQEENLPQAVMPTCPVNKVLTGQKALVTGANSGIGQAVALALAQAGADVVINYVSHPEAADAVVKEAAGHGVKAYAHQADISREDQVQAMFQKMIREFGTIDILVNNAGLQKDSPIENMTLADWQLVINVNLTGQFLCAREAVREFKRRGIRPEISCAAGKIICMSSVHEVIPWAGHVNYADQQGRRDDDDEKHRAGGRAVAHPREFDLPRRHPHAHQHGSLEHARSLSQIDETGPLQAHRRTE